MPRERSRSSSAYEPTSPYRRRWRVNSSSGALSSKASRTPWAKVCSQWMPRAVAPSSTRKRSACWAGGRRNWATAASTILYIIVIGMAGLYPVRNVRLWTRYEAGKPFVPRTIVSFVATAPNFRFRLSRCRCARASGSSDRCRYSETSPTRKGPRRSWRRPRRTLTAPIG